MKIKRVSISELTEGMLLVNLYVTQMLTLMLGVGLILLQHRNPVDLFGAHNIALAGAWGYIIALLVLTVDLSLSEFVPDQMVDDGGINEMIFKNRPLWHIAVLSLIVACCEELLFRGGVQHMMGPYWTSVLFAAIHVRYLRHWLMTGLVFAISYSLGWIYVQTGSLWSPILAHFMIDFVMGCMIRYRREP